MKQQSSLAPTNKVAMGVAVGSVITIAAWVCQSFYGIEIPAAIQGSFQTAIVFAVQWWVTDRK